MTKILIADHYPVIRIGLKVIIQNFVPGSFIVEAWDGDSAFDQVYKNDFQLMILDVNLPNTDSFSLVSSILAFKPNSKILMFSRSAVETSAQRYLQLGIKGYLVKDATLTEIKKALDNILNNKRYLGASLIQNLTDQDLRRKSPFNPFDSLSPRELEIMKYMLKGKEVPEMCDQLNITKSTISTYKGRIFEKLSCRNIIELNSLAKLHNIVTN